MSSNEKTNKEFRAGTVALLGRPNVGKSTLLNALVGEKLSIVTAKPHTTRHRILGVMNRPTMQAVFIDTPGYTRRTSRVMHRLMARSLKQTRDEADLILLVTEANRPPELDRELIDDLAQCGRPAILVLNKVDRVKVKEKLLQRLDALKDSGFVDLVPVSAKSHDNLKALEATIMRHLPEGGPLFPEDFKTDKSLEFRAAEIIREKLMQALNQEIPYGLAVQIEAMNLTEDGRRLIHAVVWIERESHKAIVIGKEGAVLKRVGRDARLELNRLFDCRVHLELWVKVREHWSDSAEELQRLGFDSL